MSDHKTSWLNTRTLNFEKDSDVSNSQGEGLRSFRQSPYSTHVSGATSSVCHHVFSLRRSNELSCQSKVSALFKSVDLINWFTISRQSDVDTYWILWDRSPNICDDSWSFPLLENLASKEALWFLVLYLLTSTWRLERCSDRYDICMTDWSRMRSTSLQEYWLFSIPSTSHKFWNRS